MKIYLILTILFLVSLANAEIKIENQWKLKQQLGETSVYLKNDMTLSILDGGFPKKINITEANYKVETNKALDVRKKTLAMLGFANWNVTDMKFSEQNGKKIVQLLGTYQQDNVDYEFTEWQVYTGLKFQTLQLENKPGLRSALDEKKYLENLVRELK